MKRAEFYPEDLKTKFAKINPSVKFEDIKKEILKDPDVKKEYEKLLEEPLNNLEAGIDAPKGSVELD